MNREDWEIEYSTDKHKSRKIETDIEKGITVTK